VAERAERGVSRESRAFNEALVGRKGSRLMLDTPALVLDLDAFERNLATMQGLAENRGIALRPHAKTHKSAKIGQMQMAAGAVGLCCAKLGEAEALAAEGLDHLLLTSPMTGEGKLGRLLHLNDRLDDLMVVVDDAANVRELGAAAAGSGKPLGVLIDVDVGTHRFGVPSVEDAVALAGLIAELPSLRLRGIQGYAGHIQSVVDYGERRAQSLSALDMLVQVKAALEAAGHACPIVTGSGTGTHDFDHEARVLTDLQVGSYVFLDVIYDGVELAPRGERRFEPSLFVYSRVVSRRQNGFTTIDAGSKSFSMDGPMPGLAAGAPDGSTYGRFGDEFGRLELPPGSNQSLDLGALTAWIVPHCDPTLNQFDCYHCVRGDALVDIWPVDARGCAA
jgi:D-serine deaminase-like pyridoxal phosphate-dependent protein